MRRLLIAATLGLGLLSAAGSAFASPVSAHPAPGHAGITRVDFNAHHAPPPRHWHRPVHHVYHRHPAPMPHRY